MDEDARLLGLASAYVCREIATTCFSAGNMRDDRRGVVVFDICYSPMQLLQMSPDALTVGTIEIERDTGKLIRMSSKDQVMECTTDILRILSEE